MAQTFREWYLPKAGDAKNLKIRERPIYDPATIPSESAIVKIHAVSLQFRDLMVVNGSYPAAVKDQVIPCSDGAGEIIALGSGVNSALWKVGDRVCANFGLDHLDGPPTPAKFATSQGGPIDGCLTEYKVYPIRSLVKIPAHLSYEEASTLPCATLTAYSALMGLATLRGGEIVLVLGSGGVSIAALQLAIASGAKVIATTSSDEKAAKVKNLGAHHVINYKTNPNWEQEVLKLTNGEGVDHALEVSGAPTILKTMAATKMSGFIHVIGFVGGLEGPKLSELITTTVVKAQVVRGVLIGSVAQFESMNQLISSAQIHPVIDKVFSFGQAVEALQYLESQKHVGKVVIKVSD